jgi:hypothetical protein
MAGKKGMKWNEKNPHARKNKYNAIFSDDESDAILKYKNDSLVNISKSTAVWQLVCMQLKALKRLK